MNTTVNNYRRMDIYLSIFSVILGMFLFIISLFSFLSDALNFGSPTNFICFGVTGISFVLSVEKLRYYVCVQMKPLLNQMILTSKRNFVTNISAFLGSEASTMFQSDFRVSPKHHLSLITRTQKATTLQDKVVQIASLYAQRQVDLVRCNINRKLQETRNYVYSYAILCIQQSLSLFYSCCCSHEVIHSLMLATKSIDAANIISILTTSIIIQVIGKPSRGGIFYDNNMSNKARLDSHWRCIAQITSTSSISTFQNLSIALNKAQTARIGYDRVLAAYQASFGLVCIYAYRLNQPLSNCQWLQVIWTQRLQQRS